MRKAPFVPLLSITIVLVMMFERPAHAYIDPGSASYLFQLIAGVLLGGVFLLRTYWNRVATTARALVVRDPQSRRLN